MINKDVRDIVARTVYGEARGEPMEGQIAVVWVIRNRVELAQNYSGLAKFWGGTYQEVCTCNNRGIWQFSCWNPVDVNYEKMHEGTISNDITWGVRRVLEGAIKDETYRATHYHADNITPSWADKSMRTRQIGKHVFYDLYPNLI